MAKVHFFAAARAAVGADMLEFHGETVQDIINQCTAMNASMAKLMPTCGILLDSIACHDLAAPVNSETRIDVLPKFAGG